MEIQGKIIEILPEQTGEGKNGTWRKNRFIIETQSQYPKKVCIDVWGEKWDQFTLEVDAMVTAHIDVESREWQGKWFTDVKAWKVEKESHEPAGVADEDTSFPSAPPTVNAEYDDDLPF